MTRYMCMVCGWVYNPERGDPRQGVEPGTPFEEVPEEWVCPQCGVHKDRFSPL